MLLLFTSSIVVYNMLIIHSWLMKQKSAVKLTSKHQIIAENKNTTVNWNGQQTMQAVIAQTSILPGSHLVTLLQVSK